MCSLENNIITLAYDHIGNIRRIDGNHHVCILC